MSDEEIDYVEPHQLSKAVQSGDHRKALVAIRDYLVHELEGHRCDRCSMSQLKTGDTASLVLRLQKVLEEIQSIPAESEEESEYDEITNRRKAKAAANRRENPTRRSGGRR